VKSGNGIENFLAQAISAMLLSALPRAQRLARTELLFDADWLGRLNSPRALDRIDNGVVLILLFVADCHHSHREVIEAGFGQVMMWSRSALATASDLEWTSSFS
jgi:hypothetical protein